MNESGERPPDRRAMATDPDTPPGSGIRLLLVSSDAEDRARLRKGLEGTFAVIEAGNAEEALFWMDERYFSLILTDYKLADRDGAWLLRQAAQRRPRMFRFLMSDESIPDVWQLKADQVFRVLLIKPVEPSKFSDYVVLRDEGDPPKK